MTEPEDRDHREATRDAASRGSGWLRSGRRGSTDKVDAFAADREYERSVPPRTQEGPLPDRTVWTRPSVDQNSYAAMDREQAGDDWRLADLQYNEADQWRNEAEVADDRSEEAFAQARTEPTVAGQEAALSTAEHEADIAAASHYESDLSYDSAERRSEMAANLESRGISRDTVDNRVRADVSQARPATEATRTSQAASVPSSRAAGQTRSRGTKRSTPQQRKGIRR